jgi:peptidoglycan/xylan/chitin deacetylase (PgdA/CDA1 family)
MAEAHIEPDASRSPLPQNDIAKPRLTYHEISNARSAYRYGITTERFSEHVFRLQQFRDERREPKITFDDGHISQFANAVPILNRFAEQATFFITASWTGKRSGYMNWNQLRELRACGYDVQSHGWSHTLLTECSPPKLKHELVRSKNELEYRLGSRVDAISMPGGRWSPQVLNACAAVGYTRVFISDPWNASLSQGAVHVIGRWMVTRNMSADNIVSLVRGEGSIVEFLRVRHWFKEFAKSLIGDRSYQTLWRAISNKSQSLEDTQTYDSSTENSPQ